MTPALGAEVERLSVVERQTFNDVVVRLVEEALQMRAFATDALLREILLGAASKAAPRVSSISVRHPGLRGNARLMMIEAVLKAATSEATERLLIPPKNTEATIALWSIAREIVEELGLEGGAWDYVNSLGSRTPPPTKAQIEMLSEAIMRLKASKLDQSTLEKVEALNVYLGLARDEHETSWIELKRKARADRDAVLHAIRSESE